MTTEEFIEAIEAAGFNIGLDWQGYIIFSAERVDGPRDLPARLRQAVDGRYQEIADHLLDIMPGEVAFNRERSRELEREITRGRLLVIEGGAIGAQHAGGAFHARHI